MFATHGVQLVSFWFGGRWSSVRSPWLNAMTQYTKPKKSQSAVKAKKKWTRVHLQRASTIVTNHREKKPWWLVVTWSMLKSPFLKTNLLVCWVERDRFLWLWSGPIWKKRKILRLYFTFTLNELFIDNLQKLKHFAGHRMINTRHHLLDIYVSMAYYQVPCSFKPSSIYNTNIYKFSTFTRCDQSHVNLISAARFCTVWTLWKLRLSERGVSCLCHYWQLSLSLMFMARFPQKRLAVHNLKVWHG